MNALTNNALGIVYGALAPEARAVRDVTLVVVPPFGFSYLRLQTADGQPDPDGTYCRSFSAKECQTFH